MLHGVLCSGLVASSLFMRAQPTYIRTYDIPGATSVKSATAMPDGGLVICGWVPVGAGTQGLLMRVDATGNLLWAKRYPTLGCNDAGTWTATPYHLNRFNDVATTNAGNLLVVGETSSGSTLFGYQWLVALLNADGDTLKTVSEGGLHADRVLNVAIDGTGNSVIGGYQGSSNTGYAFFRRINPTTLGPIGAGNMFAYGLHAVPQTVSAIASGGVLIGGVSDTDLAIARLNSGFSTMWDTVLSASAFSEVVGVGELSDGSITAIVTTTPSPGIGFMMIHFTATGQVLWSQLINSPISHLAATDMAVLNDGRVLVVGHDLTTCSWAMRFDMDGELEWCQRYGGASEPYLAARVLAPPTGGNFRIVGAMNGTSRPFVIQADSLGNVGACTFPPLAPVVTPASLPPGSSAFSSFPPAPIINGRHAAYALPLYTASTMDCAALVSNQASGDLYVDANGDGLRTLGEPGFPYSEVMIEPDSGLVFTTSNGGYIFYPADSGSYAIRAVPPNAFWQLGSDSSAYHRHFNATDTSYTGLDFGWTPLVDTSIMAASLVSDQARCGWTVGQWLYVLNEGTTTPSGVVALTLDSLITFYSASPPPDSVVGQTIYWGYDSIPVFHWWNASVYVVMPDGSHVGDTVTCGFDVWADNGMGGLQHAGAGPWSDVITCSFDPNDKVVTPEGEGPKGIIGPDTEWLTYTVRFQNTGTDTAFTVSIDDQLSTYLQWNTLTLLGASHTLTELTVNASGLARFRFDGIMLPDSNVNEPASHGFVSYRVQIQPAIPYAAAIQNNAGIFFDLNPAVVTNTVLNTMIDCDQVSWLLHIDWAFFGNDLIGYTSFPDTMAYSIQWYLNGALIPGENSQSYLATISGSYSVAFTDEYGCTQIAGPLDVIVTGLDEAGDQGMLVFPNPATDGLTVSLIEPLGIGDMVEVLDPQGRLLRTDTAIGSRQLWIERRGLAPGMYLVRIVRNEVQRGAVRVVFE